MPCPEIMYVRCHNRHANPVAFQNMENAKHLSDAERQDGREYSWRTYVAADSRKALQDALREIENNPNQTGSET